MPPPSTAQAFPVVIPVEQALRRLKLFPSSDACPETLTSGLTTSEASKSEPFFSSVISGMIKMILREGDYATSIE